MGWSYRKSKKFGPLRLTVSKRGISAGTKVGPLSVSRSTTGHETRSMGWKGFRWSRRRKRP